MMLISEINIYPIKGCRGVGLQSVEIDRLGLVNDRRLMLVDRTNRFISQRECPSLATITASRELDALRAHAEGSGSFACTVTPTGTSIEVSVWGDNLITAVDQGDDAARWFSEAAGVECRLVSFGPDAHNPVDRRYSSRPDAETAFTDGYPVMITSESSLASLNEQLAQKVGMDRFRPSVVVRGGIAWGEDDWKGVRLGTLELDVVKPCARCTVTTTDQATGAVDAMQEPLRTLARFRTMPGLGAIFGQNLIPRGTGEIRVGDTVQVM